MRLWVGIALVAAAGVAGAAIPSYHLAVTAESGARLWTVPVAPGALVTLAYVNSIYRAPTEELLTVTATGFLLRRVRSTSEAVLAYNGLPAPYARDGAWYAAPASARLPALTLRIGRTGRQRLLVQGRLIPLYEAGEGAQLRVTVQRMPLAAAALRSWIGW